MSTFDRFKRKVLDIAGGTAEVPLALASTLGGALLALPEAGAAGLDWSDRPKWTGGEGSEGLPLWNREEGAEQFGEAMQRYAYQPKTVSGQVSSGLVGDALALVDKPFSMFGEGIADITGSEGMGEAAYWLTSLGTGAVKPAAGLMRKGLVANISPEARIIRQGWYNKNPLGQAQHYLRMPVEMLWNRAKTSLTPQAIHDATRGWSSATAGRMRKLEKKIKGHPSGTDAQRKAKLALKREYAGEISKEISMRRQYGLEIPSELEIAGRGIFPKEIQLSATEILNNPQVLSDLTGMQITDAAAKHITPHIVKEFNAIERGIPVNLAHKVESNISTGQMMSLKLKVWKKNNLLENDHLISNDWPIKTVKSGEVTKARKKGSQYRATISDQPLDSMEAAWDSLMTKRTNGKLPANYRFKSQDFLDEIDELNMAKRNKYQADLDLYNSGKRINSKGNVVPLARSKTDGSIVSKMPDPPEYLNRPAGIGDGFTQLADGDGMVSFGYSGLTADPLLGHVRVRTVLNPETGRMLQVGMDQLALGAGKKFLNKLTEPGMKNQFISITPSQMSFSDDVLIRHNLKDKGFGTKEVWELGEGLATGKATKGLGYGDLKSAAALHKGATFGESARQAAKTFGPNIIKQGSRGQLALAQQLAIEENKKRRGIDY